MRILFIGPLPEPTTGQSLACQVLLDHLRAGHTVTVIDLAKRSLATASITFSRLREVAAILHNVSSTKDSADVIYFTISESVAGNIKDLLVFALLGKRLERLVIHLNGGAGMRVLLSRRGLLRSVNIFFLRRMGGVIVLGKRLRRIYHEIIPAERLYEIPNFAEDYLFHSWSEVAEKFDDTRVIRILFLSNLIWGKGYRELVAAYRMLALQLQARVSIDFAGSFGNKADEDEFMQSIQGYPSLRYLGSIKGEAKKRALVSSHVFCLPTYYPFEGQPISILEAYATGCVVITTDHSGIFDVFAPGRNGIAVERKSVDSLCAALSAVITGASTLIEMAKLNHTYARDSFRREQFCEGVSAVLGRVKRQIRD